MHRQKRTKKMTNIEQEKLRAELERLNWKDIFWASFDNRAGHTMCVYKDREYGILSPAEREQHDDIIITIWCTDPERLNGIDHSLEYDDDSECYRTNYSDECLSVDETMTKVADNLADRVKLQDYYIDDYIKRLRRETR